MKTKKTIKLSLVCDNDYSIISHIISKPNKHDCKFIEALVSLKTIKTKKKSYLVGDKGYISKKTKQVLKRKGINLITPLRSNQKNCKKINEQNKKYMRNRFKIESTIGHLKRSYKRLQLIYDRNIDNFETFLIMGISCQLIKKIYK